MNRFLARAVRAALCVALSIGGAGALAQSYPSKPVRIIVPFGPGGVGDISARVLAQKMSETMGQQVLVENRPSAGGIVASETVAKADPDGHTLLLLTNGQAVSVSLFKSLPYDAVNDFAPVSTLGLFDMVVLVNAEWKISSVSQLIAAAKLSPGKLNIATINPGGTQHLAAELFKSMAGIDVQTVPFKGTPAVLTALRGNEVQAAFEFIAPALAQIKAGTLKPLAVTSKRRFSGLPDVPTVAESGVPGYEASAWNGIAAPAKTPRPIVERLNKEVNAALASPEVRQRLQGLGVEAQGSTPGEFREFLVAEIAKWRDVIERAKIEKQ
jgi:tripartite-type tricarboxylate transporter receptor subunit TctC